MRRPKITIGISKATHAILRAYKDVTGEEIGDHVDRLVSQEVAERKIAKRIGGDIPYDELEPHYHEKYGPGPATDEIIMLRKTLLRLYTLMDGISRTTGSVRKILGKQ